jgi:tRNA threonylcarbamoyl adenosine modification protein YeaZ
MKILAIDTSANLCAACVFDTDAGERGRAVLDLGKGHAEHLMTVIDDALNAAGSTYADIGLVGVSVGPGSFTGIRVGVAAARGLALALKIPSVGVTTLDALADEARAAYPGREILAAIDARRDQLYLARYEQGGERISGPVIASLADAVAEAGGQGVVLAGSAADMIAAAIGRPIDIATRSATADIGVYAKLAARQDRAAAPPRPLYLRDADAKPQQGFAVARKS